VGALLAAGYFLGAAGPDKTTVMAPAESSPSAVRATSQGMSQAAGRLGGIIGVTAYGVLADTVSPGAGLVVFGAAALVGAAVSLLPTLDVPREDAPPLDAHRPPGTVAPVAAIAGRVEPMRPR
jgi:sugar phosphate permease